MNKYESKSDELKLESERARKKKWYRENKKEITLRRKIYRDCNKDTISKNAKKWRERHPDKVLKSSSDWARRNREKLEAHRQVFISMRRGDMDRVSCVVCADPKSHAHHEDYSKPLEVVWLCRKHHAERHMALRAFDKLKETNDE